MFQNNLFVRNGPAIFITKNLNIKKNKLYGKKLIGYEMPFLRSIDINTKEDFNLAVKIKKNLL